MEANSRAARKKGQVSMEPVRGQDVVHTLMVKVNRISVAGVLILVVIYGLVTYRGTTATQGPPTSGVAHLTTASVTGCGGGGGSGSTDSWPLPVRGPR